MNDPDALARLLMAALLAAAAAWPGAGKAVPNVRINDVTVTEGVNSSAVFTVSIDANPASGQNRSVRVAMQNGTVNR